LIAADASLGSAKLLYLTLKALELEQLVEKGRRDHSFLAIEEPEAHVHRPPRDGESKDEQRKEDRLTQVGPALRELGIGSILAYSPQAIGRIEQLFDSPRSFGEASASGESVKAKTSSTRESVTPSFIRE
jgi:hypothetical protein